MTSGAGSSQAIMGIWELAPAQARAHQETLRDRLILRWDRRPLHHIGGADVSIRGTCARAAMVVLSYPDLERVAVATATVPLTFPYIPGLLSWRECPALLAAWEHLEIKPDLVIVDGQGITHPRGFGLAAHLGLLLGVPAVGVAKSHLYGLYVQPGRERGAWTPLHDERAPARIVGGVLRTRTDVRPVYVSPGHLIDVPHAISMALSCTPRYRLPEPIRCAHRAAAAFPPSPGSGCQSGP